MSRTAPPLRPGGIEAFIPSSGDLLVRDNLSDGMDIPMESFRKTGHKRRPATMGGYRFGQMSMSSFFTRHNPQPKRVNHFKGLLDVPICTVNDFDSAKKSYSLDFPPNGFATEMLGLPTECINVNSSQYPMDTLTGLHYFHPLKMPFGKRQPTGQKVKTAESEPWRQELQELAKAAGLSDTQDQPKELPRKRTSQYSAATGRLIPPPTKGLSRSSTRARTAQFLNSVNTPGDILGQAGTMEDTVMMMLCQILQTEDVDAVQKWLGDAGENERSMVQELIKAAMSGKEDGHHGQYPVREYMIGLDGLPMTPDIGAVIGDNVQNRLSTADDEAPIPDPSMMPPSHPGPDVDEVVNRIEAFSPRIPTRASLPPIAETLVLEQPAVVNSDYTADIIPPAVNSIKAPPKPLPSIQPKQQQSFNKALENITRRTLESLSEHKTDSNVKKFTTYNPKTGLSDI